MERKTASEKLENKFSVSIKCYTNQYSHLYNLRLRLLRERLSDIASKWMLPIKHRIIDIEATEKDESTQGSCVLIGTLFKLMPSRSSVLDEFRESMNGVANTYSTRSSLVSDDDSLVLEDDSGRIALGGVMTDKVNSLVSGIVIAVKGMARDGEFIVEDFVFAGQTFSEVVPAVPDSFLVEGHKYVLLVSGLQFKSSCDIRHQMLLDYICGRLTESNLVKQISKVIVLGNSVTPDSEAFQREKSRGSDETARGLKRFDSWLAQLAGSCPVHIIPGEYDPANVILPQQPLSGCLFSHASRFSTVIHDTNPAQFSLDSRSFLCHSGQPLSDIERQTKDLSPTDILRCTLQWSHIAPTCPDTLACYPFTETDPLIIPPDAAPDVYLCGNQTQFSSQLISSDVTGKFTRICCVPSFTSTGQVVLVDLTSDTLNANIVNLE